MSVFPGQAVEELVKDGAGGGPLGKRRTRSPPVGPAVGRGLTHIIPFSFLRWHDSTGMGTALHLGPHPVRGLPRPRSPVVYLVSPGPQRKPPSTALISPRAAGNAGMRVKATDHSSQGGNG